MRPWADIARIGAITPERKLISGRIRVFVRTHALTTFQSGFLNSGSLIVAVVQATKPGE